MFMLICFKINKTFDIERKMSGDQAS